MCFTRIPSLITSLFNIQCILVGMVFFLACGSGEEDDGSVEADVASIAATRLEAETMTKVGYLLASSAAASGGQFVQLLGATGTLTKAFTGSGGTYDIYAGVFDENDGVSKYELSIANQLAVTWTAGENKPGANASAFTRHRRLILANRALKTNDAIQVKGFSNSSERAPFDYIEFVPVSTLSGIAARPNNTTCVAPPRPVVGDGTVELRRFGASDLVFNMPMRIDHPAADPGGDRLYIAEREGDVWSIPRIATATAAQKRKEFSLPGLPGALPVQAVGGGGVLGMAFHPQFATNGHLFLSYTTPKAGSVNGLRSLIVRVTKNFATDTWGNLRIVIGPFEQPLRGHSGGDLRFGPLDGYLYASFGDGGTSTGDLLLNGQRKETFFSKILRIDVSTTNALPAYTIPATNPWPTGQNGFEPATFAYGFRNPFRFGIDSLTGEVWVGDVGHYFWEEVDLVSKGKNYGWDIREGAHCHTPMTGCATAGLTDPVFEYPQEASQTVPPSEVNGASVIGGTVIRNSALGAGVQGRYIFADFVSKKVWTRATSPVEKISEVPVVGGAEQWVALDKDASNNIYAVALVSGKIYRLEKFSGNPLGPSDYPPTLSETGCFGVDPKIPSTSLIPFEINSALWSDGADKERFFAIPNGKKITVMADGDFDFPPGSVTVKTFLMGGKRIETRFYVRHDDGGWEGYTYEWNADQSQAFLLKTNKTKIVGDREWYYPSRSDCAQCHTDAAGNTLGPEIKQLNRNALYKASGNNSNQIETLKSIGLFNKVLGPASTLGAYLDPLGKGGLQARARSYLHANCSSCHRPNGGASQAQFDSRFQVPFAATNTCNVAPIDTLGITGAMLIAPGDPSKSVLLQRMLSLDDNRMPLLGSHKVHVGGTDVIRSWITSLTACP